MENKIKALAKHLECDIEEIDTDAWNDDILKAEGRGYLVLTDEEADEKTKEYILETIWAFDASFLAFHSKVADEEVFKLLQEKCEDANEQMKHLIDDLDYFVEDAITGNGRERFLSPCDGEEYEEGEFFIYRVN